MSSTLSAPHVATAAFQATEMFDPLASSATRGRVSASIAGQVARHIQHPDPADPQNVNLSSPIGPPKSVAVGPRTPENSAQIPIRGAGPGQETDKVASGAVVRSKKSPEIYRVNRNLYVGKLKELPPPRNIQEKWDKDVRFKLETHLGMAINSLVSSMTDEELVTEPVLCMAGEKCSPKSAPSDPGEQCPVDPVLLLPTVWINCGSKACRKKVKHWIPKLGYLFSFLRAFRMKDPVISLEAPFPAFDYLNNPTTNGDGTTRISFAIERPQNSTLSGAKARFTVTTEQRNFERYSTIGGLICVGNQLYAVTTAHGLMDCFIEATRPLHQDMDRPSSGDLTTPQPESRSDSGTDSDSSSCSDSLTNEIENPPAHAESGPSNLSQNGGDATRISSGPEVWLELDPPKVIAYMGRGTRNGDYNFPETAPAQCDFALIHVKLPDISNVICTEKMENCHISGFVPRDDMVAGDIAIVSSSGGGSLSGYLLDGESSLILRGAVMQTKKIQVPACQGRGISGSWVIQNGRLCGYIFAAYHCSPYLHMISAENMFLDIENFVGSTSRVASFEDIEMIYSDELRALKSSEAVREATGTPSSSANNAFGAKVDDGAGKGKEKEHREVLSTLSLWKHGAREPESEGRKRSLTEKFNVEDPTARSAFPTAKTALSFSTSAVSTEIYSKSSNISLHGGSDASKSITSIERSSDCVVRGFSPGQVSSFFPTTAQLASSQPTLKPVVPQEAEPLKKERRVFMLGPEPDEGNRSSFDGRMQPRTPLAQSLLSESLKNAPASDRQRTKLSPRRDSSAAWSDEDDSGNAIEEDEESATEDDVDEWDEDEDGGSSAGSERVIFRRIDSRPNITSRRSLLTTALNERDRAEALQKQASQLAEPRQSRTFATSLKEDHRPEVRGIPIPSRPPIMTTSNTQPTALSPRTTRRNMLATELTDSLRKHLIWERQQKKSATSNPALKRRHSSNDIQNLKHSPDNPSSPPVIQERDDGNYPWETYFDHIF